MAVDAEIVAAMAEVMRSLGLVGGEFQIRINNRKLVDALLAGCGVENPETQKHVLRVIDKLQKAGLANIRRELGLGRVDESGDPIRGVGLPEATIEKILQFIGTLGAPRAETLTNLAGLLAPGPITDEAVREMTELNQALSSLQVAETEAVIDPSLMRGLDYCHWARLMGRTSSRRASISVQ